MSRPEATVVRDFFLEVAKGNVPYHLTLNKFGSNGDIDTGSVPEDIWSGGGIYVAPTQARIHDIVSSSINDTDGGTGAREVKIQGLDANWDMAEELVTLDGTNNVATTNSYIRVYRMFLTKAGSLLVNDGNITATAQVDSTVSGQITASVGQTLMAVYTVPSGYTGYVTSYFSSIRRSAASAAQIELGLYLRVDASNSEAPLLLKHRNGQAIDGQNPYLHHFHSPITVTEKSDIFLRIGWVSDNNIAVDGGFEMILVKDI